LVARDQARALIGLEQLVPEWNYSPLNLERVDVLLYSRGTRRHCPECKTGILADKPKTQKGYICIECHFETLELPVGLIGVRFHDLRHTAVSRMIAARVPLPIIAKIVGWTASTMAKMAAR